MLIYLPRDVRGSGWEREENKDGTPFFMPKDEQDDGLVLLETFVNKSGGRVDVWTTSADVPAKATACFNDQDVLLGLSGALFFTDVCVCVYFRLPSVGCLPFHLAQQWQCEHVHTCSRLCEI